MLPALLGAFSLGDAFDVMTALRIIPCQNDGTLGGNACGKLYLPTSYCGGSVGIQVMCRLTGSDKVD